MTFSAGNSPVSEKCFQCNQLFVLYFVKSLLVEHTFFKTFIYFSIRILKQIIAFCAVAYTKTVFYSAASLQIKLTVSQSSQSSRLSSLVTSLTHGARLTFVQTGQNSMGTVVKTTDFTSRVVSWYQIQVQVNLEVQLKFYNLPRW